MKAAVVNTFGIPPSFQDFREPVANQDELVITVHAAPLSPIVKKLAAGTHYTSATTAGFVPGVDGVGVDADGRRVYFLFPKAPFGSMAEKAVVSRSMTAPVPDSVSSDQAAAIATGGLASWIALTRRARLLKGETVMVIGATGAAGGMALQTAKFLGATKVIAVGRNEEKLAGLSADVKIALNSDADEALHAQFKEGVDIVLDFVWGEPAIRTLKAAAKGRGSRLGEPRVRYVQVGNDAGLEIPLPADLLRSTGIELIGSGIGSVAIAELLKGATELLAATPEAGFIAPFSTLPLHAVAEAWTGKPDVRYVLMP